MSTHKNDKNIALAPDLLKRIEDLAGPDRTVDEVANEAIQRYVDAQENIRGLRSLVAENRAEAIKDGWTERSIASVVKKHRQEKSRR
jgi:predicted transcriptional regulator